MGPDPTHSMGDQIPVLVISMATATARRDMQAAQLGALGVPFRFLDATVAADLPTAELARLDRLWCRPMRPAEVACALSHRRAWDSVAAGDGPVLILEDDAILARDTAAVLAALAGLSGIDCVNLETFTFPKRLGSAQALALAPYSLAPVVRDSGGAAAYLLWPSGARKALAGLGGYLPLADAALNLAPGLRKVQLEPACAIQAMFLAASRGLPAEITGTTVSPPTRPDIGSRREWLRYKLRRLRISALLAARTLRAIGRSETRTVPFRDG